MKERVCCGCGAKPQRDRSYCAKCWWHVQHGLPLDENRAKITASDVDRLRKVVPGAPFNMS